jgi:hypothetical protein
MSRTCRGGWRANQTSAEQPRLAPWDPNDQRTQEDTPMTVEGLRQIVLTERLLQE